MQRVLIGGDDVGTVDAETRDQRGGESFRRLWRDRAGLRFVLGFVLGLFRGLVQPGHEFGVAPDRLAVGAPIEGEGPARQAFARIPFALAVMQKAAGREALAQPSDQIVGERALRRADRRDVPFRAFEIVDRDEGRLAAHGEAHVLRDEIGVDLLAEPVEPRPGLVGKRRGDARRLADALDPHLEAEFAMGRLDHARDRRAGAIMRRGAQRQVALAAEQPRGRVEPDPAGAGQIDLGPGVQIGEIMVRALGAFERLLVGRELDQIAGDETRGETKPAQRLHQKPGRIAAGARTQRQRLVRRLHAGLHADHIFDLLAQPRVEADQKIDRAEFLPRNRAHEVFERRAGRLDLQRRREFGRELGRVGEGELLGVGLDEEIERVEHGEIGQKIDLDAEFRGLFGEHQPRQPIAVRVLLPIDEMLRRRDLERIAGHAGAAMRRRAQPHDLRPKRDIAIVFIMGDVVQGDLDRHGADGLS